LVITDSLPRAGVAVADLGGDSMDGIIVASYQKNRLPVFVLKSITPAGLPATRRVALRRGMP